MKVNGGNTKIGRMMLVSFKKAYEIVSIDMTFHKHRLSNFLNCKKSDVYLAASGFSAFSVPAIFGSFSKSPRVPVEENSHASGINI